MFEHIQFLQRRIYDLNQHHNHLTIPTMFEYYSAIQLTEKYQKKFYVYKDLTPSQKKYAKFPLQDKASTVVHIQ